MNGAGTLRHRLYIALDPVARRKPGLSLLNWFFVAAILIGTFTCIFATEPEVTRGNESLFAGIELVLGVIFLIEYLARLWVTPEGSGEGSATQKRLRFVSSPSAILDLVVLVATFGTLFASNVQLLRLFRLLRIIRVAKLARMSMAMHHLWVAVKSRRYELLVTMAMAAFLVIFGATALYIVEGDIQPDKFGSIPRALWWSVITLTTIGYGDVSPATPLGKMIAACVAVAGVGFVAMPTGIMAAAFSEAMQRNADRLQAEEGSE